MAIPRRPFMTGSRGRLAVTQDESRLFALTLLMPASNGLCDPLRG